MEEARIQAALNKSEDAFWDAVADQFSEVKTGDLSSETTIALRQAMEKAIREWLENNLPVSVS